ncbi:cytochrome-c peroxidase [Spirosoma sp. KNUC1025]|uniref:cytochrome-c peroxidase n=1 Tax=Spirosoma sp. KNUC1025 TaxID=2894082 RepID=UPI00386588E5|nr:cytochrome C peroxidase [Spirosoma sp. KNUC1025]
MYRLPGLLFVICAVAAFLPQASPPDGKRVYQQFLADKHQFHQQVQKLTEYTLNNAPADSLQLSFKRCRQDYKRIEWLVEYFQPFLATHVNGPPVVEVEVDEPGQKLNPPTGLQVIEPYLFPAYDATKKASLIRELNVLLSYSERLERGIPEDQLTDTAILAAMRQELFRLLTWGITGYDAPETQTGLAEAAVTLRSLQENFRPYTEKLTGPRATQLKHCWAEAINTLEQASDFSRFDRVSFIRQQLYPLCRQLQQVRETLGIPAPANRRFLSPSVATLSDSGAFRPNYLINFGMFASTPSKVALGRTLFFDPLLSGNNERSCASCHQPERAFTDERVKSRAFRGRKSVIRNAPTLINAGLQNAQFYDLRVSFLEDQAHDVLSNAHEMHTSPDEVVQKLSGSDTYKKWFAEAFPTGLSASNIRNALASYIRSLTSLKARSDRYLRGENVALSADEKLGFNLFLGKARCATCHFFPIYNGFVPPHYEKVESEIIGVPRRRKIRNARLDDDPGRFNAHKKELHRFSFKTPTVRNVALTAPYMHNGAYKTLDQVVDFYDRGGGRGIGVHLEGQTLSEKKLNLTTVEKKALVAFMHSLTDTVGLNQRPAHLPAIEGNPALSNRKIGGNY